MILFVQLVSAWDLVENVLFQPNFRWLGEKYHWVGEPGYDMPKLVSIETERGKPHAFVQFYHTEYKWQYLKAGMINRMVLRPVTNPVLL